MDIINYDKSNPLDDDICFNSFPDLDRKKFKKNGIVVAESFNFGILVRTSFNSNTSPEEKDEADDLKKYYYEYFIERIGDASYKGYGFTFREDGEICGRDVMKF